MVRVRVRVCTQKSRVTVSSFCGKSVVDIQRVQTIGLVGKKLLQMPQVARGNGATEFVELLVLQRD